MFRKAVQCQNTAVEGILIDQCDENIVSPSM
jgi:hypothetical protein